MVPGAAAARLLRVLLLLASVFSCGASADNPPPLDELTRQLSATSAEVRREAAYRLNQLGTAAKPALPALIKALEDPDKQVWAQSVAALANLGPAAKDAIPALLEALDTRERRGRRERDRVQTIVRSAHALSRIGAAAIPPLIAALESEDSGVRAGAAKALGGMGPTAKPAILALRANLGHGEGFVRREVVDALGQMGAPAVAPLIEALGWKEAAQRVSAALALGQIGREEAGPALQKLLATETDPLVRSATLTALPRVSADARAIVPLLIAGLKSDHEAIRSAATGALLGMRSPADTAIPALLAMLQDANPAHVERAAVVLGRFGSAAKSAAPEIAAIALRRQPPPASLLEALVQIGAQSAPALVAALAGQNPDVLTKEHWLVQALKTIGTPAIAPLTTALATKDVGARFGAVRTLGEMGLAAQPALPALLPLAGDADPRVRAMVLGTLAAARVEPPVLRAKIEAALTDPVAVVRLTAIQLVPYLGEDAATLSPALHAALKDADPNVQRAAREVLDGKR